MKKAKQKYRFRDGLLALEYFLIGVYWICVVSQVKQRMHYYGDQVDVSNVVLALLIISLTASGILGMFVYHLQRFLRKGAADGERPKKNKGGPGE